MKEGSNSLRKMECEGRCYFYFKYSLAALNRGKRLARKEIASHRNHSKSIIFLKLTLRQLHLKWLSRWANAVENGAETQAENGIWRQPVRRDRS